MGDAIQPIKVAAWHEQLALYMIANPTATNAETAKHFKVTPQYICILKNSDAFKAYYARRVDRQFDRVMDDIFGQTVAMTAQALEKLNHKIATIGDTMTPQELLQITDTGLKRLGYGATKFGAGPVTINNNTQNNIAVVNRDDLDGARRKMAEVYGVSTSVDRATPAPGVVPSLPAPAGGSE
jgi:hypothetical protein